MTSEDQMRTFAPSKDDVMENLMYMSTFAPSKDAVMENLIMNMKALRRDVLSSSSAIDDNFTNYNTRDSTERRNDLRRCKRTYTHCTLRHLLDCGQDTNTESEQLECLQEYRYGYVCFCATEDYSCTEEQVKDGGETVSVTLYGMTLFNLAEVTENERLREVVRNIPAFLRSEKATRGLEGYIPQMQGVTIQSACDYLLEREGRGYYGYVATYCAFILRLALQVLYPEVQFDGWYHDGSMYPYIDPSGTDDEVVYDEPNELLLWNFSLDGYFVLDSDGLKQRLSSLPSVLYKQCQDRFMTTKVPENQSGDYYSICSRDGRLVAIRRGQCWDGFVFGTLRRHPNAESAIEEYRQHVQASKPEAGGAEAVANSLARRLSAVS